MSPRYREDEQVTPISDSLDKIVAAHLTVDRIHDQHPKFVEAALTWMEVGADEILHEFPDFSPHLAQAEALARLSRELRNDGEDAVLIGIVDTLQLAAENHVLIDQQVEERSIAA